MALKANESGNSGGNFEPMEPGSYPARLVGVTDLGLQPQQFKGEKKKPAYEVALTYEFVDEFMKDEDGKDRKDKPRWLTEMFPLYSLESERAKSTQRIQALDPNNEKDGDLSLMLETPVTVIVVHSRPKNGRIYENIDSIAPMREKDAAKCDPLVNETFCFDLSKPDLDQFEKLPNFLKKKITDNLEFAGSELSNLIGNKPAKDEEASEPEKSDEEGGENPY